MYSTFLQVSVVCYETQPRLDLIYEAELYKTSVLVCNAAPAPNQNGCQIAIATDHRQVCSALFSRLDAVESTKYQLNNTVRLQRCQRNDLTGSSNYNPKDCGLQNSHGKCIVTLLLF